jgi:putative peptidoglycan lipid II flippase
MTDVSSAPSPSLVSRVFRSQQAGVAAFFVTLATLLSTVLGLVRNKVMAHYFGASLEMDLYNYGIGIPDAMQTVLIMGVTSSSFIPIFSEYLAQKGTDAANRMASSFMTITLAVFIGLCLAVGVFMPVMTSVWLGSDMPVEQRETVVLIARIFLVSQIAFALSKIHSGILQTHKHFMAYGLALVVYNPSIILGVMLFHEPLGIYSAPCGAVVGALMVVWVNWLDVRQTDFRFSWTLDWDRDGVRRIMLLALPSILNMGLLRFVFLAYQRMSVDMPEGSYSAFAYALDFESFPVSVFGISFVTAIFPYLSENASRRNYANFNYNVQNSLRQILFLTLPAGFGMSILSFDIIALVLGGGKFGVEGIAMTGMALAVFALVVPLESLWYLFARAYYAVKDTWTPFWFRLIGTAFNLALCYVLAARFGATAFSIGLLAAFLIQITLFVVGLKRKVPEFDIRAAAVNSIKLGLCALAMGAVVIGFLAAWDRFGWMAESSYRLIALARVGGGIMIGAIFYFALTMIFKCADFSVVERVWARVIKRRS